MYFFVCCGVDRTTEYAHTFTGYTIYQANEMEEVGTNIYTQKYLSHAACRETEGAIERNWQHWVHKTQDHDNQSKNTTRYVLGTTIHKTTKAKKHKTICVGHNYIQTNTNNVYMSHPTNNRR